MADVVEILSLPGLLQHQAKVLGGPVQFSLRVIHLTQHIDGRPREIAVLGGFTERTRLLERCFTHNDQADAPPGKLIRGQPGECLAGIGH